MATDLDHNFSLERFQSLLHTESLGRNVIYERSVDSTMDVARAIAGHGASDGMIVLADEQTRGRGRFGRRWIAPSGLNLTFSLLLRPSLSQVKGLPIIAPLAIVDGLRAACGLECSIKWPNDVQVHDLKLAGVLIEAEMLGGEPNFAIAGVGLNVNFDPPGDPQLVGLATSLLSELGCTVEREAILAAVLDAFEPLYEGSIANATERWKARLNTLGRQIRVRIGDRVERGLAEAVTEDGSLVLLRHNGSRVSLIAGEVSLRAD